MGNILFIMNPAGSGGRGTLAWERFRRLYPEVEAMGRVAITEASGHATLLASAADDGTEMIAVVGGDGTVREVVNGLMARPGPRPPLAIIPSGTGNDIARMVGILSLEDAADALRQGGRRRIDLIRVDCLDEGRPALRYACLTVNVGFSEVVIRSLKPWMKRRLGGERAYLLATLLAVARYRPPYMTVRWEDQVRQGPTWMVNVGNGEWEGGGRMRVSPGALIDDGILNLCIIRSGSKLKLLRKLPGVFTGAHLQEEEVSYQPATRIEVESDPPVGLQMDGDVFGTTPVTLAVCPLALEVVGPAVEEREGNLAV